MPRLSACHTHGAIEAGCDEAGRGCLAGPVVAAAVILPMGLRLPGLNDSKQLSEADRERLRPIIERKAIAWCVAIASVGEIDAINILQASILAMHRAIAGLSISPKACWWMATVSIPTKPFRIIASFKGMANSAASQRLRYWPKRTATS
jgi:ribonuclease HII